MNQQDFLKLRKEIVQRARVIPRPTPYQIQVERMRAHQLAQFIRDRLAALHLSQAYLAQQLDIEREFVRALVSDASFPVSELSTSLLKDLATILRCEVRDLKEAMQVNGVDLGTNERPLDQSIDLPSEQAIDIDE